MQADRKLVKLSGGKKLFQRFVIQGCPVAQRLGSSDQISLPFEVPCRNILRYPAGFKGTVATGLRSPKWR
jgi:hypothetical protein